MYKIACLLFCTISIQVVSGQFSLSGNSDSSSGYPRIKLAGPLGQLIGGQGLSLNSGFGQVLSSIINSAANAAGSSGSGGPLSQLATAASTNYINAIRSNLPFAQFASGNQQQQQHAPQYGAGPASHHMFGAMQNPMNFLAADSSLYGGQPGYDNGQPQHFGGSNTFSQYPGNENYFGSQYGGGFNQHAQSSNPLSASALYSNPSQYSGHVPSSMHHLDK